MKYAARFEGNGFCEISECKFHNSTIPQFHNTQISECKFHNSTISQFHNTHAGQVVVYFVMALVAVFLLALLSVDVFMAVRAKNRLQNGGDAAALAAAHRQGELINEIGHLNIRHIEAALKGDAAECDRIVREQYRLALVEPVYALAFASDAAERNGLPKEETFSEILAEHANDVRTIYAGGDDQRDPFPEPYPGAWTDYANAISAVADAGLAAGADNIEFYFAHGSHLLLEPEFYSAIASEDWCWFFFDEAVRYPALKNYAGIAYWGDVPLNFNGNTINSEIFSLHLAARRCALTEVFSDAEILKIANGIGGLRLKIDRTNSTFLRGVDEDDGLGLLDDPDQTWFFFDTRYWDLWFSGKNLIDDDELVSFPNVGDIKDEYNVRGCAAVCRTIDSTDSLSTDTTRELTWCAAAKPFGTVEAFEGVRSPVTALRGFVAPCMGDTRLVSVDSVGRRNLGTADILWVQHVRHHLPDYLQNGPPHNSSCFYCRQLATWEKASFRQRGVRWLKYNSGKCFKPVHGGTHMNGGTSHGH